MPPKQAGKTPRKRRRIQSPGITVVEPTTSVPTLPQNNGTGEPSDGAQGATHQSTSLEPRSTVTQVSNQVSIDYVELAKQILVQQQNLGTHTASQPLTLNQATTVLPPVALTSSQANGQTAPALSTEKSSTAASSASQPLIMNQATSVLPPVVLTPSQPNGQTAPALSTEKSSAAASSLTSLLDTVFAGSQGEGSSPGPSANFYPLSSLTDLNSTTCSILAASLSGASRAAYRQSWNLFQTMNKAASSLPLSLQNVCNFIGYLFEKQYSASSIASHVSALSYLHKLLNLPDPTQTFIVKKLLKGCSRLLPSQDTRLPITKEILHKLIKATKMTVSQPLNQLLLKALYLLCFNAFLRLGEVVVKSVADRDRVLQVQDVTFHGDGYLPHSVQIVIRHHKTQKKNDPIIISIQGSSGSEFCPVQALHEYCTKSPHSAGPFFQFVDGTPVTYSFVSSQLSKAISFAGFDPKFFKGHSFRIGAATHAAQIGYSESCIQHLGRWNSNALHRYIRIKSFQF